MLVGLAVAAGIGTGFLAGFAVAALVLRQIIPSTISAVGAALLSPGAEPEVTQPDAQEMQQLFTDLAAQMEPEPVPRDLDWMNE